MALISCPECKKKISDTTDHCPKCGFQLTPEIIADIKKKEQKTKTGCAIGCLSLVAIFLVLGLIGHYSSLEKVIIEGDTARKNITFLVGDLEMAVYKTAEAVYEIAEKDDKINKIVVSLYLSSGYGGGLQDKYGNQIKDDLYMGDITIEDLNEVRKYKRASTYAQSTRAKIVFGQISIMNHAYLLK